MRPEVFAANKEGSREHMHRNFHRSFSISKEAKGRPMIIHSFVDYEPPFTKPVCLHVTFCTVNVTDGRAGLRKEAS